MRGELRIVWEDTYREIWGPLAELEEVPEDLFSQLYRELSSALKEPFGEKAQHIPLADSIQLREAFDRALSLAGGKVELARADQAFADSGATNHEDVDQRRVALESSLEQLIGDRVEALRVLSAALSELAQDPGRRTEAKERALDAIVNDTVRSRDAFQRVRSVDLAGERSLVGFLEATFDILEDLGGDALSNGYFGLLAAFVEKFSLRYDLRRPCVLCPTLPGVFASLMHDVRALAGADPHLDALMRDFENAVRDLRQDCADTRIKTCIQKQVNLLEAIGRAFPGVTGTTLGAICDQVGTWPHHKLKAAMKDLYGFASDYPGIRHGGTPGNVLRAVDMRDMVAMSILLTGFAPYLCNGLNPELVYRGA